MLVLFGTEIKLSNKCESLQFKKDIDRRHAEICRLPSNDASGGFVEILCDTV